MMGIVMSDQYTGVILESLGLLFLVRRTGSIWTGFSLALARLGAKACIGINGCDMPAPYKPAFRGGAPINAAIQALF